MLSNKVLVSALMIAVSATAAAQSSSNSPYTRYGLGELSDQGFAYNAAMGGIGYGIRNSGHINVMNPASFTSVDSLSFMFDAGMSLKRSNFQENGIKSSAQNSSFDYLAMQFRLHPRIGMAISFTPFSTVGYNFSQSRAVAGREDVTATSVFYGDGGLQQITAGLGVKVLKNLSVGVNAGYLYGNISYQNAIGFNTSSDQTNIYNKINVRSYVADFGIQYTQPLSKTDQLTFGVTYGLGHNLNSTETKGIQVTDNQNYSASNETTIEDSYGIPHKLGVGVAYNRGKNLTAGVDYSFQKWSDVKYDNQTGLYKDRSKIAAGAEFTPNPIGRNYFKRIRYRVGGYYSTAYLKLPQYEGPSEYGISAGFGLPLYLFQRNSVLNITGQYIKVNPSVAGMLSKNRFVLKIGLTFNERWFMKWKVN